MENKQIGAEEKSNLTMKDLEGKELFLRPTIFSKRLWLNPDTSWSTGSVVAFHGPVKWGKEDDEEEISTFLEVSDCHGKVRLHKTHTDTITDFIIKMRTLSKVAVDFADFLESRIVDNFQGTKDYEKLGGETTTNGTNLLGIEIGDTNDKI